jgi:replicative DNA helicase
MSGQIVPLRAAKPQAELEELVVGAVLDLPDKLELVEAMGLASADFQNERIGLVWGLAKRMTELRMQVSAVTVCSQGQRVGRLAEADLGWLTQLESRNALTKEQARQVADDLRTQSRARQVRAQLLEQVELIDRGRFSPVRTSGALEAIVHSLATDFAPDETAESDLMAQNVTWEKNLREGKTAYDPTGIRLLDELIGGLPPNVFFIEGRPGVGKNGFLGSMIRAQLMLDAHLPKEQQSRTGLVGLEDGTAWLPMRLTAANVGIPMRAVGSARLTPEQELLRQTSDETLYPLLQRIEVYKQDTITRDQLLHRAMNWVFKKGVRRIFIDNLGEVTHMNARDRMEHWQGVAETVRVMRNFAFRFGVPVGFLVHDTESDARPGQEGPPDPRKMAGGKSAGNRARLVLGIWSKGDTWRATVTKGNTLGPAGMMGPTIEFERLPEAGLINPDGGRLVDLRTEAAVDRRERKANAREEAVDESIRRAELKAKRAAAKAAEKPQAQPPPEQPNLFDTPTTEVAK